MRFPQWLMVASYSGAMSRAMRDVHHHGVQYQNGAVIKVSPPPASLKTSSKELESEPEGTRKSSETADIWLILADLG